MTTKEFIDIIDNYVPLDDSDPRTDESYLYELTNKLNENEDAILSIEPILRFIEKYPTMDFGSPGSLVHTIERFQGQYEQRLFDSLDRKPTTLTVWMLNRIINEVNDGLTRTTLIKKLECIVQNPTADSETKRSAKEFIQRHADE